MHFYYIPKALITPIYDVFSASGTNETANINGYESINSPGVRILILAISEKLLYDTLVIMDILKNRQKAISTKRTKHKNLLIIYIYLAAAISFWPIF